MLIGFNYILQKKKKQCAIHWVFLLYTVNIDSVILSDYLSGMYFFLSFETYSVCLSSINTHILYNHCLSSTFTYCPFFHPLYRSIHHYISLQTFYFPSVYPSQHSAWSASSTLVFHPGQAFMSVSQFFYSPRGSQARPIGHFPTAAPMSVSATHKGWAPWWFEHTIEDRGR